MDLKYAKVPGVWFDSYEGFKKWEKENPDHYGFEDDAIIIKMGSVKVGDGVLRREQESLFTLAELKKGGLEDE